MKKNLIVVASCTKRKRITPDPLLCLRNVPGNGPGQRFNEWRGRINAAPALNSVRQLYAGDHWTNVLTIESANSAELWVCSAGLGLIRGDALVPAYSATFSRSHPDSAVQADNAQGARQEIDAWWSALRNWDGPEAGQPRLVSDIAKANPSANIIIIAAGEYLRVMASDIWEAANQLRSNEQLTLFSADARDSDLLSPFVVPITADLTTQLGGSLHSLNARTARYACERLGRRPAERRVFVEIVEELMESADKRVQHNRTPISDDEVTSFIKNALASNPNAKKTRLLRDLRDSGRACEQKRFGDLYMKAVSSGR